MTTGSSNELMQDGIRHVREGRNAEAYQIFKQVVANDPDNEFAWIWISVTSDSREEKRAALERALQINPNSPHAKEALRAMDAQENREAQTAQRTAVPGVYAAQPQNFAPNARIGEAEVAGASVVNQGDPLRASLTDVTSTKKGRKDKKAEKASKEKLAKTTKMKPVKPAAVTVKRQQQARGRTATGRLRFVLLGFLLLLLLVLGGYFLYQQLNKPQEGPVQAEATPTAIATTEAATTAAETTVAATTAPTTTEAATTAAAITTVAATTPPATLPSGAEGTAAVAKALQEAHTSEASGDYKAAISAYQNALQADSRNVTANLGLGNAYMNAPDTALPGSTDRYAEAARAYRVVTSQSPNWSGGYAKLGQALAAQGDVKGAINAYIKSLELDPNGPERWLALAELYDRDGQADQAKYARDRANSLIVAPFATPTATPTPAPAPTNTAAPAVPTATPKR
ncbi:MAG TPA: tetratricopeptide repeat protein [Chloroflexia bacterium]|nr:tetratricopeptide repeat protein [Chloroflexia bacterium]